MDSMVIIPSSANALREEFGLKEFDTISDIVALIKKGGYDYQEVFENDPFYGSSEYVGGGKFKISYNLKYNYNEAFKRFTLAHELGHITLHHQYLRENILHRSYVYDQLKKEREIEADYFAANLLAPSKPCSEYISNKEFVPQSIKQIAEHFNISQYAAILRFIELTDLACCFIVCNLNGKTEYERRSKRMLTSLKHSFVRKTDIHPHTLTYEYIKGKKKEDSCRSKMSLWHSELPKDVPITECVLDLGYNNKLITMITPEVGNLEDYFVDNEYSDDE